MINLLLTLTNYGMVGAVTAMMLTASVAGVIAITIAGVVSTVMDKLEPKTI